MSKIWDIIQTVIFGPEPGARFAHGGVVSAEALKKLATGDAYTMDSPWVDYWQRMGVDDPEAAARTCLGYAHLGPWNAEMMRLRDARVGFAGRRPPVVVCVLGRWPAHRVEIEPVTLDLTYGGVKVQEKVVKYIIRVDGKEIGTVDQYIVET